VRVSVTCKNGLDALNGRTGSTEEMGRGERCISCVQSARFSCVVECFRSNAGEGIDLAKGLIFLVSGVNQHQRQKLFRLAARR
jgi:hypothetical protein